MVERHDVVVVGAGPCGLGALRELRRLGVDDVRVLEADDRAGGLAASTVDPAGFTWDRGGHVVFSHHGEFDALVDEVLGEDRGLHDRSSWVRAAQRWVPYPLQRNLHRLPPEVAERCLIDLVDAAHGATGDAGSTDGDDLASWAQRHFGAGIVECFFQPYNTKVWATDLAHMSSSWIAERVAEVDWREAVARTLRGVDDVSWGPNDRFAFPTSGGTGEIWRRAAEPHADRIAYGAAVVELDPVARTVATADGRVVGYQHLISTVPLDLLAARTRGIPAEVASAAAELVHTTVHVVGIGVEAPLADDRSWLYFASPEVPFYRATNFAKYAAANVPGGDTDRYSSWMCEVSSSATHPIAGDDALIDRVDAALRTTGVVAPDAPVASRHLETVPYAYPVPTRGRDDALRTLLPWFDRQGVLSRGRFGTWRYEVGNMDHAVKMGIDAARRIVDGTPEELVPADLVAR